VRMIQKPTYEELEQRIRELEIKLTGHKSSEEIQPGPPHEPKPMLQSGAFKKEDRIEVSDIDIQWDTSQGLCTFENLPVAMMWIDTTLAGFMSGVQAMVGTERFGLALQSEGRKSVEADWEIISQFADFFEGFRAIANIAAVAGWGNWELILLDEKQKRCRVKVRNSWEGLYQKALRVCWGSGMLAGKMAGYCSKHFGTNCWADQRKFIAKGDEFDEFLIAPSERTVEEEIENLLGTDEATRADMAVALEKLKKEISVRERAEKTLRESEEKYRRLVDLSFEGIAIHCEGKIVYINNTGAELIGAGSPQNIIGKPVLDFVHPDYRDSVIKKMRTIAAKGIGASIDEERFIGIDGRELTMEVTGVPVDYQGKPAIQAVFRDITDLKLKEKALSESERHYRLLIENIPTVAWVTRQDGRTVFISSNVEKVYGFTTDEVLASGNKLWYGRIHPDDRDHVKEAFRSLFDQKVQYNVEYRIQRKDGQWIWIHDRANIVEEKAGAHFAYGVFSDITDRKRAEEEKAKLQNQLQQAQKMEAIGTLAGGIAHDFNNLLMGIQGRASLMSVELDASHPHSEHLNAIEEYIRSATDLTKQLLGFARGGKYEVKTTDMNELVLNSATMFGRTKREIQIHTKLYNQAPVVEVDRSQIEQVLLNMYVNAWQAMPDGGELYLETKIVTLDDEFCKPYQAEPGRYVTVSVTDTGIGMDEATRQRVFDPFFTTQEKGRGTGLGLASAYGIIKNHRGMITVYSESGHGTTFSVYLPLSNKEAQRETPVAARLITGAGTILLVDDEEMIIDVGKAMLERLGYRVFTAPGGQQAVEAVTRMGTEIDLVILDMIMPGMDGGKTFDRIREIQPQIPVMLSSGYAINGQAEEIMRRGCNGFIQKPFNMSEFSKQVRKILDEAKNLNIS
jgi:two-component system cell cycle sensor histidine kinase/response regulator CckA